MGALSRNRYRLPPLAVGLGIYLPAATTSPAVLGAVCGYFYNRWVSKRPDGERAKRLGVYHDETLSTSDETVSRSPGRR